MDDADRAALIALLTGCRWAALATVDPHSEPWASRVAIAPDAAGPALLMHLSSLAAHSRHLALHPRATLLLAEDDDGRDDPQTLARVSIFGTVHPLERGTPDHDAAAARYRERFPASAERFGFGDFTLFGFVPERARLVSGFGRAYTLGRDSLVQAMTEVGGGSPQGNARGVAKP